MRLVWWKTEGVRVPESGWGLEFHCYSGGLGLFPQSQLGKASWTWVRHLLTHQLRTECQQHPCRSWGQNRIDTVPRKSRLRQEDGDRKPGVVLQFCVRATWLVPWGQEGSHRKHMSETDLWRDGVGTRGEEKRIQGGVEGLRHGLQGLIKTWSWGEWNTKFEGLR